MGGVLESVAAKPGQGTDGLDAGLAPPLPHSPDCLASEVKDAPSCHWSVGRMVLESDQHRKGT